MSEHEQEIIGEVISLADARRRLRSGASAPACPKSGVTSGAVPPTVSKRESLERTMAAAIDEKRQQQEYRNLGDALLVRAGIPNGKVLVILIGDGTERDNRDVMCRWVCRNRHLIHEARDHGVDVLEHLYARLQREFEERVGGGMA